METPELHGAYALIKFGREEHLKALLEGRFHCRSAEYYRLCERDGAGDRNESALLALRGRDLEDWQLVIDGHVIDGVVKFTARRGHDRDQYIHSWAILRMPKTEEELDALGANLDRLRTEFGPNYVAVTSEWILELLKRVRAAAPFEASLREVRYDGDTGGSPTRKHPRFAYQSEARFLIGESAEDPERFIEFDVKGGLGDILSMNPEIKIAFKGRSKPLFLMSEKGVFIDKSAA